MNSEALQQTLYDQIFVQYEQHYDDPCSQRYRSRFLHEPLLGHVNLESADVLEAMCGSGQVTEYLLGRGARVTGLDISTTAIASFCRRFPGCKAIRGSIFESGLPDASFDHVMVIGGLHHLHPRVFEAVAEIHRLLRPGGCFFFIEPHLGSLPNLVRRWWYRRDPLFASNEAAVDVEALKKSFAKEFAFLEQRHLGNVGYLLILNSLIFRVPLSWKRFYTPGLLCLEGLIQPLQTRMFSCFVTCRWRKT